jgi:gamma-glutamyltranspeptidase/glutathione hydrolase
MKDRATTDMTPSVSITHQSLNTTHYSIVDKNRNAVSVTYTLNSFFGAKVIAGNTGFFLNNEMDDFASKSVTPNQFGLVQGVANNIQPGKRPLSSMTPTIILKDKNIFMVLGSPGGPRIITASLETILNVINYKMNLQKAVNASRFHHQWLPDTIDYEPNAFSVNTIKQLEKMGYHLRPQETWGAVEAILLDPSNGMLSGANDIRRPDGKALGY